MLPALPKTQMSLTTAVNVFFDVVVFMNGSIPGVACFDLRAPC
jgi:hypothetical protein